MSLPDKIIPIPCSDKEGWSECWDTPKRRNLLNIPHSWSGFFIGPPSSGKSTMIKNLILRAKPRFREVLVYHFDPDSSSEWDDVDAKYLTEFPDPKSFDRNKKRHWGTMHMRMHMEMVYMTVVRAANMHRRRSWAM